MGRTGEGARTGENWPEAHPGPGQSRSAGGQSSGVLEQFPSAIYHQVCGPLTEGDMILVALIKLNVLAGVIRMLGSDCGCFLSGHCGSGDWVS